jgi:hypothetical protein
MCSSSDLPDAGFDAAIALTLTSHVADPLALLRYRTGIADDQPEAPQLTSGEDR